MNKNLFESIQSDNWTYNATNRAYTIASLGEDRQVSCDVVELIFEQYCAPRNRTVDQISRQIRYGAFSSDPLASICEMVTHTIKAFGIKHRQNFIPPHIIVEAETEAEMSQALIRQKTAKIIDLDDETSILQKKVDALEAENAKKSAIINELNEAEIKFGNGSLIRMEVEQKDSNDKKIGHVFISDMHIGKVINTVSNSFDISIAYSRAQLLINSVYETCTNFGIGKLFIHMMGDMVDGPAGTMHADQQLHQDVHFDDQVSTCGELMSIIVDGIENAIPGIVQGVFCIGGNHGRFTRDRTESPVRMADNLAYKIMSIHLKGYDFPVKIVARDDFYTCSSGNTAFIVHHGDKLPKKPLGAIFEIMSADRTLYGKDIVWVHGHTHTPRFEQLQSNASVLSVGSYCGPDEYALKLGKGSKANQSMMILNEDGSLNTPIFMNL